MSQGGRFETFKGIGAGLPSPVYPDELDLIYFVGGTDIVITPSPATSTIDFSLGTGIATTYDADTGTATPALNILDILGGDNIATVGAGSAITISVADTTDHALQVGNATGSLTSLGVGTDGQVLISATGANPAFATLTSTGGTITFTQGANSLNLEAVGGGGGAITVNADTGNAVSVAGVLNLLSGDNVVTTGAGNTLTVGLDGFTNHALVIGNITGGLDSASTLNNGELLIGRSGLDPIAGTLDSAGGTVVITEGAGTINLETGGALATSYLTDDANSAIPALGVLTVAGGNNLTTSSAGSTVTIDVTGTTQDQVQIGNATGSLTSLGAMTDGQIIIGSTAATPVISTLTAGVGASITNAAGSITIGCAGGGLAWNEVAIATNMAVNNGYIYNAAGAANLTLPDTAAQGSIIRVTGIGAGMFTIAQNAGETIHFGNQDTTTGVAGSVTATVQYDAIELVCTTANTDWTVLSSVGNFVIA